MFYKKTKGILPTLVETLVNKRKETNKIKNTLDEYSLQYQILEKRQLALKVSANSLYGFLGADKNGKMPLLEGAMAITFMGRTNINIATQYMVDEYGAKFIYSDTDSSMVTLPAITRPEQCQEWGERLAQEISGWNAGDPLPGYGYRSKQFPDKVHKTGGVGKFPPPLRMEFEKAMRILCLCKKKYAYFKIEPDGSFKKTKDGKRNYIEKKGIILARRGNPMHLQRTYENILYNILSEGDLESSLDILTESAEKLIAGEVPVRELVAIRELGSNYKQEEFFMNVFSKSLLSQGVLVAPGDRLGFVIVESPPPPDKKDLLGYKMRLIEKYEESEVKEPISISYYLEKILTNPIDQLIGIGHRLELLNMFHVSYLPPRKRKCIYLEEPMKMIYHMYLAGKTVQDFRNYVEKGFQYARLPRTQFVLEDE
jgi:DNA polymerase delta subunit 1